jgi:hypothetical protein
VGASGDDSTEEFSFSSGLARISLTRICGFRLPAPASRCKAARRRLAGAGLSVCGSRFLAMALVLFASQLSSEHLRKHETVPEKVSLLVTTR